MSIVKKKLINGRLEKFDDISYISKIANGNFSEFFGGRWKHKDGEKNIVVIRLRDIASNTLIQTEFESLSKVNHENVLKLYDIAADYNGRIALIMENADCGSFHEYLHGTGKENGPFKFVDIVYWILQIAKGCEYLQKMNPEIKDHQILTSNMLLAFNYRTVKICNFGSFSQSIDKFVKKDDVFCIGIVLWEILSQEDPFDAAHIFTFIDGHPPLNDLQNDESTVQFKQVIEQCWNEDSNERITLRSLVFDFGILYENFSGNTKEVPWSEITLEESPFGFGAFSDVFKATWETSYGFRRNIVAKRIRDIENVAEIAKEVSFLSIVNHENIIKLYGETRDQKQRFHILTEYADCGSLYNYLHGKGMESRRLSDIGKLNWLLQLSKAVAYLHEMDPKILHRDLKTHNILLANKYKTLKVCDFGSVTSLVSQMSKEVGTIYYMAPELFDTDPTRPKQPYTEKCDVYSFGIILWEIMSRQKPFRDLEYFQIQYKVALQNERPPGSELQLSENYKYLEELAERCWKMDPSKRPTMKDVAFTLNVDPSSPASSILQLRPLPLATDSDYM